MGLFDFLKKETKKEIKFNNNSLRIAVKEWCKNESVAIEKYGHISGWDTSEITDMSGLFLDAHKFNSPIGNWNVSNVLDMNKMFAGASSFNQEIGNWDVSNVEDMTLMFDGAISFNNNINWSNSKESDINRDLQIDKIKIELSNEYMVETENKIIEVYKNDNYNSERYYVYLEQFIFFIGEEDDEVDDEKYFIALSVSLKSMDSDEDDGEIDDTHQLVRSVLNGTNDNELILTYLNGEKLPLRISELPEIIESELYEDYSYIEENLTLDEAIRFIKSLKTIDFKSLKSESQDQRLLINSEIK